MLDLQRLKTVGRDSGLEDFERAYRTLYRKAVTLAHALAGRDHAEDIAQEALLAAYRNWEKIENPEHWIARVVANRSRSHLRRRYIEKRALGKLTELDASTALPESTEHLWAAVRSLPPRQAQVIALHYVGDYSTEEISGLLACSVATVRVHRHRAYRKLSQLLPDESEEPGTSGRTEPGWISTS